MTTWQSLLYCSAADVTLDRIRNLAAVTGTEPLTVEFKEGGSTTAVAECAAAMANLHGGLIVTGVTDQDRQIVGVPREAMAHVADALATHLESPDWQPEMNEVPLDDGSGRYVLVLRVNAETAPRPVFVQLTARFSKESGTSSGRRSGCPARPGQPPRMSCAHCSPSSGPHSRPRPCGTWRPRGSRTPRTAPTALPWTSPCALA
jgi:Schlafen, AlbA_2